MRTWLPALLLVAACAGDDATEAAPAGVRAIVDPTRATHFLDHPFPDASLADADGFVSLAGFPAPSADLPSAILAGWQTRIEQTAVGFGNLTPAWFRFEGPLDVPETTEGRPTDPVLWVAMDGSGTLLPLQTRFVEDPGADPWYPPHTLGLAPVLGAPPSSGVRYAAVVMTSAGAAPAAGWTVPADVREALDAAGVSGEVAVATTFTVQDAAGQMRALRDDVDGRLSFAPTSLKEVVRLTYAPGETPSGRDATVATVEYADGTTRDSYLGAGLTRSLEVDLGADWPMVVYEAEIETWNYQGLADRPYMSPALGHIADTEEFTGWIDFVGDELASTPEPEIMRITVSVPRAPDGTPGDAVGVVLHDHGTGGHAYNIVQRRSRDDDGLEVASRFAEAGWATIGRDASLYGTRYPLIDEGYSSSLGYYNIVNTPAFRDNQRQTALDGYVLRRWVDERLAQDLPAGTIDTSRVRKTGHSLGSVTSHLQLAMAPELYESALVSGTGGLFLLYYFDTGLLDSFDDSLIDSLFLLLGAEAPEGELDTTSILGAVLGLPEEAWADLDRMHPATMLFQWQMDPSDPMAVAHAEDLPITAVIAPGDRQTPDFTAEALVEALPDAVAVPCEAQGDYDPHYCLFREQEGYDALSDWLSSGR